MPSFCNVILMTTKKDTLKIFSPSLPSHFLFLFYYFRLWAEENDRHFYYVKGWASSLRFELITILFSSLWQFWGYLFASKALHATRYSIRYNEILCDCNIELLAYTAAPLCSFCFKIQKICSLEKLYCIGKNQPRGIWPYMQSMVNSHVDISLSAKRGRWLKRDMWAVSIIILSCCLHPSE